ncbi:hypothetical protein MRB53_028082 [Persea americana]|uniref:Uncharacterized protein n=1 Tax=Persea americana TaxID=3435 RepID=A0ACC2KEL8_PERAE|nr:hypothetical protein MRB53_028082 [Persea americana]
MMTGSHNTGSGTESNMVGFRFKPTDEELVSYYLKNKAMGKLPASRFVVDAEVYKVEPWHLPGVPPKQGVGEEAKEYYFFTRCNRKDKAGNKTDRSAGAGLWRVTCGDRQILDSHKRPIGLKRSLVFKHGRDNLNRRVKNKSKNWIMKEYRLPSEKVGGWVLCRIKKSNRRVPEERDEDDEKIMGATTGPVEEIQLQESCNGGDADFLKFSYSVLGLFDYEVVEAAAEATVAGDNDEGDLLDWADASERDVSVFYLEVFIDVVEDFDEGLREGAAIDDDFLGAMDFGGDDKLRGFSDFLGVLDGVNVFAELAEACVDGGRGGTGAGERREMRGGGREMRSQLESSSPSSWDRSPNRAKQVGLCRLFD